MAAGKGPRVGCFLVLLVLLGGGWLARDTIAGWLAGVEFGVGSAPSERLANRAGDKIDRMLREGIRSPVRFSEAELQSLLTYRAAPSLPAGIEQPRVDVQDSVIVLSALVRPEELKDVSAPDALRSMLADTSRVTAGLLPLVEPSGWLTVRVRSLQIGSLVVPTFLIPLIVEGFALEGVRTSGGVFATPIPGEVGAIRIEGEDVVIEPVDDS
ncbi:MAG: hypothetical protein ACE5FP_08825 [Gemmatimonadota bacterium]